MTAVTFLISGAGEGNRTLATSLEGWGSTIELHPHKKMVGAAGFEPATPWSQARCATKLRYAPIYKEYYSFRCCLLLRSQQQSYCIIPRKCVQVLFYNFFYNFCKKLYTIKNHHKIRYSSYKTAIIQALYCLLNRRFHPIVLYFTFKPSLCEHPHPHGQRYREE